jgi:fumarate hydratase class II
MDEIMLKENENGRSIMKGKVNKKKCEEIKMVEDKVMGNNVDVNVGGRYGKFEINVFKKKIV